MFSPYEFKRVKFICRVYNVHCLICNEGMYNINEYLIKNKNKNKSNNLETNLLSADTAKCHEHMLV
jgi:hypothetical protein